MAILPHAIYYLYIGVNEPELAIGIGKVRCPDAAGIRIAFHIQKFRGGKGVGNEVPMHQILGMMNLHTGEPLKGGGGNIVVIACPDNAGVRVEPF